MIRIPDPPYVSGDGGLFPPEGVEEEEIDVAEWRRIDQIMEMEA
ncbi:hypothetical protein [Candidatus Methanocrinis natronophilus]|uniref:Uncharacterized protein n=1 Tax=Candidatus Methanocrinis natronophilus TaxID=3033396 RepID=A0ABT5X505_9EURY|nr:hypothetical protein [Candidatus Methanocrinis natronophilus]MDF0589776.1 hypothetical protein [Candidatus Methanocrinis natronophilus]